MAPISACRPRSRTRARDPPRALPLASEHRAARCDRVARVGTTTASQRPKPRSSPRIRGVLSTPSTRTALRRSDEPRRRTGSRSSRRPRGRRSTGVAPEAHEPGHLGRGARDVQDGERDAIGKSLGIFAYAHWRRGPPRPSTSIWALARGPPSRGRCGGASRRATRATRPVARADGLSAGRPGRARSNPPEEHSARPGHGVVLLAARRTVSRTRRRRRPPSDRSAAASSICRKLAASMFSVSTGDEHLPAEKAREVVVEPLGRLRESPPGARAPGASRTDRRHPLERSRPTVAKAVTKSYCDRSMLARST
jgi:hypothetical protein